MPITMRSRRLSRPTAPSCRGGASSLLRLAQTGEHSDFGALMQRATAVTPPGWPRRDGRSSIITLLEPSRELAPR